MFAPVSGSASKAMSGTPLPTAVVGRTGVCQNGLVSTSEMPPPPAFQAISFAVTAATDTHDALEVAIAAGGISAIGITGIQLLARPTCEAFAQAGIKAIESVATGIVANQVIGKSAQLMHDQFGLSDVEAMRIAGDSVQLLFLLKAAREQQQMQEVNCFAGDTLVQTPDGAEAIDQIHVGQRVLTQVAEGPSEGGPFAASDPNSTTVDPATWKELTFTMPDPANVNDSYTIQLLEPISWITSEKATIGGDVDLDLPELQIKGPAEVESIDACPTIEDGPGRVVLGTFEHVTNDLMDVRLRGESAPLQVTAGHKLWSLDRDGWVEAGDLKPGEQLAGAHGSVTVESVTPDSQSTAVYNLDVDEDHQYLVTEKGVLAHNADPCGDTGATVNVPPLGMTSDQFEHSLESIKIAAAADDVVVGIRGSSVTGVSFTSGPTTSPKDYDFFVVSDTLYQQGIAAGAIGKNGALSVGATVRYFPQLTQVEQEISALTGLQTTVRVFSKLGFDRVVAPGGGFYVKS